MTRPWSCHMQSRRGWVNTGAIKWCSLRNSDLVCGFPRYSRICRWLLMFRVSLVCQDAVIYAQNALLLVRPKPCHLARPMSARRVSQPFGACENGRPIAKNVLAIGLSCGAIVRSVCGYARFRCRAPHGWRGCGSGWRRRGAAGLPNGGTTGAGCANVCGLPTGGPVMMRKDDHGARLFVVRRVGNAR